MSKCNERAIIFVNNDYVYECVQYKIFSHLMCPSFTFCTALVANFNQDIHHGDSERIALLICFGNASVIHIHFTLLLILDELYFLLGIRLQG